MNIVIITVSALATIAVFFEFVKLSDWCLFGKTESANYARDIYILIENERHGYLYKKGDCPHDLSCKYHNLMEHFKNHEYYNIKAEKLLQLDSNFTVDELNKQATNLESNIFHLRTILMKKIWSCWINCGSYTKHESIL